MEDFPFPFDKKSNKMLPMSYGLVIRKMWKEALVKAKVLITWNKELRRFQISSNKEVTVYH